MNELSRPKATKSAQSKKPANEQQAPPAGQKQARRVEMRVRPTAPILPPSNIQGNALMVVIAIMAFLACLTLGAVSMVRATASSWQSQISREITIQIKPDDGLDMNAALKKVPTWHLPSSAPARARSWTRAPRHDFWSRGSAPD